MKTAVDWLINELAEVERNLINKTFINNKSSSIASNILRQLLKQAKEMEKQQIIEARVTAPIIDTPEKEEYQTEAENYYQETYGTK